MELYVHIPFCAQKCYYCDFLSAPSDEAVRRRFVRALCAEIRWYGAAYPDTVLDTVFFGGGTPSILEPDLFAALTEEIRAAFALAPDAEITLEANPGTVTAESLEVYRSCGVSRLSFGLQSANDGELRMLGRIHDFHGFLQSYELARKAGFSNINIDVMTGLPGQTVKRLSHTLKEVIWLHPEHVSAYALQVEEKTPLARVLAGERVRVPGRPPGDAEKPARLLRFPPLPDEDTEYALYAAARDQLEAAGYERYEISNYARPGFACRHNVGYWERTPYIGVGPGAASLLEYQWKTPRMGFRSMAPCIRRKNRTSLEAYLRAAERLDPAGTRRNRRPLTSAEQQVLTARECMEEFMFLGLRQTAGVSRVRFRSIFGKSMESVYGPVIRRLAEQGLMEETDGSVRLTSRGLDVSTPVLAEFLLDDSRAAGRHSS